jgi:hypothetical protein
MSTQLVAAFSQLPTVTQVSLVLTTGAVVLLALLIVLALVLKSIAKDATLREQASAGIDIAQSVLMVANGAAAEELEARSRVPARRKIAVFPGKEGNDEETT